MAMVGRDALTCDLHDDGGADGGAAAVDTFTVTHEGVTVVVDVCGEHAAPLRSALRMGARDPRKRALPAGRSRVAHAVKQFDW